MASKSNLDVARFLTLHVLPAVLPGFIGFPRDPKTGPEIQAILPLLGCPNAAAYAEVLLTGTHKFFNALVNLPFRSMSNP